MKLLPTSVGVTHDTIRRALVELLGKPVEEYRAVQISTALWHSDTNRYGNSSDRARILVHNRGQPGTMHGFGDCGHVLHIVPTARATRRALTRGLRAGD